MGNFINKISAMQEKLTTSKPLSIAIISFFIFSLIFCFLILSSDQAPATHADTENHTTDLKPVFKKTRLIKNGDTLNSILRLEGISLSEGLAALNSAKQLFRPKNLREGQKVTIRFFQDSANRKYLSSLSIELRKHTFIHIVKNSNNSYSAHRSSDPLSNRQKSLRRSADKEAIIIKVQKGDTIARVLRSFNIKEQDIHSAIKTLRKNFNPKSLSIGQKLSLLKSEPSMEGKSHLLGLAIYIKNGVLEIRKEGNRQFILEKLSESTLGTQATAVIKNKLESNLALGIKKIRVTKGANLIDILTNQGISLKESNIAIRALRSKFNPKRLRAGKLLHLILNETQPRHTSLQELSIPINKYEFVNLTNIGNNSFEATIIKGSLATKTSSRSLNQETGVDKTKLLSINKNNLKDTPSTQEIESPLSSLNIIEANIKRGDTLMGILISEGVDRFDADRAIRALRNLFNPRRLRQGQKLIVITELNAIGDTILKSINIKVNKTRYIEVTKTSEKTFSVLVQGNANSVERLNLDETAIGSIPINSLRSSKAKQSTLLEDIMMGAIVAAAAPPETIKEQAKIYKYDALKYNDINHRETDKSQGPVKVSTPFKQTIIIKKGDTLSKALSRTNISSADIDDVIDAFRKVHNPRNLQIGQVLTVNFVENNNIEDELTPRKLSQVALNITADRDIIVTADSALEFSANEVERDLVYKLEKAEGQIKTSLYDGATKAGLPINILMEMVQIFSFDVDFQREIQKGDSFSVLYRKVTNDVGETVAYGPVVFASLSLSGQMLNLYRHEPPNTPIDYFNAEGRSARKALMRTPINGARLSSGYGMRRHPILGYNKMHKGVDFAAPRGTPIVAAGDGVIEKAGRNGAYGKYIRIRHNSTYKTAYAHMKNYARGMRKGKRVRQGQTIGYVGSTGRSTGPHLHYEVLQNGKRINPRKLKLPTGKQLKGDELLIFKRKSQRLKILLSEVSNAIPN